MTPAELEDLGEHLVELLVQVVILLKIARQSDPVVVHNLVAEVEALRAREKASDPPPGPSAARA